MFSPPQDGTAPGGGGDLESRLRGLILNNSNSSPSPNNGPATTSVTEPKVQLPPHMRLATPEEQASYLEKTRNRMILADQSNQPLHTQQTSPQSTASHPASSKGSKRPNQAQRRQMNSQLSIPIDNRSSNYAQNSGFGRSPGQGPTQWAHSYNNPPPHMQQNQQRYNQHQGYSPRFQNHGPPTPYSPQSSFSQGSPRSPMPPYQQTPRSHNPPRQSPQQQQFVAGTYSPRTQPPGRQLYQPGVNQGQPRGFIQSPEEIAKQSSHLEALVQLHVPVVGIDPTEASDKETFRAVVEQACREAIAAHEQHELGEKQFDPLSVQLQCFGSMMSGFATKASDMDLALLSPKSMQLPDSPDSPIPRLLEKTLLNMGFGARLLTRTRVPIIKLCEKPTDKLRADLLQEREKWETGFIEEVDPDEELEQTSDTKPKTQAQNENSTPEQSSRKQSTSSGPAADESNETKLAGLKQRNQPHLEYLNSAKRVLRKLGGRDYSIGSPDLNETESKVLHDVCKAYISGLSSIPLVQRLKGLPSISPLFESQEQPICRTLQGLSLQVEGERLLMGWDKRPLSEDQDQREHECLTILENWRTLQHYTAPVSFTESLKYSRDLYILNEKLKRINSLQLVYLEQFQHEEPFDYHSRAERIADHLRGSDRQEKSKAVTPVVVRHYVRGINNQDIREAFQKMSLERTSLPRVALQHRVMQLAVDYKHALKTHVFEEADVPTVEEYIKILEGTNVTEPGAIVESAHSDTKGLIARIRTLPDPSATSLNKPRDRYKDHLEFPKSDIGIQCDINFSAHLAIHNTLLLRCYSHCDPRVKIMILFIKHWAKTRGINTPYRGSLSSYGYVLMVLHYLVNVAQPFVCPNLQNTNKDPPSYLPPAEITARTTCNGCDVRFWRNESEIRSLAERKMLNHNHDTVGFLLRGFFEYYAQNGVMSTIQHRGFDWGREVLSLRTPGGILSKQEKGWVGAKTTIETNMVAPPASSTAPTPEADITSTAPVPTLEVETPPAEEGAETKNPKIHTPKHVEETKEIRHRYLFAIEDPFELDHNVARTVTHNGIVSIRDEFRRAWRIIRNIGKPEQRDGGLLDALDVNANAKGSWRELLDLIHGPPPREGLEGMKELHEKQ